MPTAPIPHPNPAPGRIVSTRRGPRYVPGTTREAQLVRLLFLSLVMVAMALSATLIALACMQGEIQALKVNQNELHREIQQSQSGHGQIGTYYEADSSHTRSR